MKRFRSGAIRRPLVACAGAVVALAIVTSPASAGLILEKDVPYLLHDHPDGSAALPFYGLRLDELIDVSDNHDIFTFSFDHPDADMRLTLGDPLTPGAAFSIHIQGTAFGGLIKNHDYVAGMSGLAEIDFLYQMAVPVTGDPNDLIVLAATGTNSGTIRFLGDTIPLIDKANRDGFTFRLGDESDNDGHRGFEGISGWGWLNHSGRPHVSASDWLFTLEVPTPGAAALMAIAMGLFGSRIFRKR